MIKQLHAQIVRISTRPNFFMLLAIFIGMNLYLVAAPTSPFAILQEYSGGASILDLEFMYTPDEAYEVMAAYGERGRAYYVSVLARVDLFTPLLMTLVLSIVLSLVFGRAFPAASNVQKLNLLPVVAMIGDYLENVTIVSMMLAYPIRLDAVAVAASIATAIKFLFTIASVGCILFGVVVWLRTGRRVR